MAKEQGLTGDPRLPQKDEQNPFIRNNPSMEVLKKVFDFPFPPDEMEVSFKKTEGNIVPLPLSISLHSLYPIVGVREEDGLDFDSGDSIHIKGDTYEERIANLNQMLKSGFETVTLRVGKFKVKSGQLKLTDNEVGAGKGFEIFNDFLLPTVVENGYEFSSINVSFDKGYTYSTSSGGYDGDVYPGDDCRYVDPHSLKYNGRTLRIYEKRASSIFHEHDRLSGDQDKILKEWWKSLQVLDEQKK